MNHLSLFSGSGIGTLAAAECGIRTVAHAENDPACCYCLERLWPDARLFKDVRNVTAESIRRLGLGEIDIISGGFPCQDLSTAGRGAGIEGSRSGLWREMFRIISQVRPRWILVENVPAIKVRGVDRVLAPLARIGYTCWPCVVGAWAVGAPHKRDRVWIVGRLEDAASSRLARGSCGLASDDQRQRKNGSTKRGRLFDTAVQSSSNGLADPIGNLCGRGGDESERGPEGRTAARRAGETVANPAWHGQRGELSTERADRERTGQPGDSGTTQLGHPASDDKRRAFVAAMHGEGESGGRSGGGGSELADAAEQREREPDNEERSEPRSGGARKNAGWRSCWPSRPGEPQHEWERPRLVGLSGVPAVIRRLLRQGNPALVECSRKAEALQEKVVANANAEFRTTIRPLGELANGLAGSVHGLPDGVPLGILSKVNKQMLRAAGNAWVYELAVILFQAIMQMDQESSPPDPF